MIDVNWDPTAYSQIKLSSYMNIQEREGIIVFQLRRKLNTRMLHVEVWKEVFSLRVRSVEAEKMVGKTTAILQKKSRTEWLQKPSIDW